MVAVANVLATARHWLPWEREAQTRHSIRVALVLQGMAWARADWLGHSLVARGRIENGTRQPAGYDSDAELAEWLPDFDDPCPICGRAYVRAFLEQVHCSTPCAHAAARNEAFAAARVGVTGPPRCLWCFTLMEVSHWNQRYCNDRCAQRAGALKSAEDADADLGAKIRNARMAHRMTQINLAKRIGVSNSLLANN